MINLVQVDSEKNQNRILIFVKVYPNVITPDNLYSDIFISSISDSPITALYHTVKKVFAPVLLRNERWSEIFNPKLQNLLCDLEAGLGTVVRQTDPNVKVHQNKSLSEIQTPLDEFKYWADKSINGKSDSEKQRASYFYEIFNQLENGFSNLNSLSLVECKDFFDIVFTVLDDIWKQEEYSPPYPQDRMEHLLDIIGNAVAIHIQKKLSHLGLWEQSFSVIEDYLHQAIDLCETWQDICQKLTTIFWPNFRNHPWKKSAFIPKYIVKFSERLLQILDLRAVHYQLTKLLSLEEQNELQMNKVFLVFKDLNPLQYNSYTDQIWKSAIKRYEDELFPAEKRVANKLRMQLQTTQNNVLQDYAYTY
ncbi:cytoplasmic dynein 2 heavy chain 1-like [Centruroides sculpturatus]|uniref:cytoplasmic dynein 2 heavy chain 1-like n=1 Tax=Centruroides sculpturatus TaxID=218467 RepID=UPI000C6DA468|nr:cytoplasmic dynein 2 heavy chain 1-like [Centruroides sculpturatus]